MELLISCLAHLIKTFLPALGKKEFRPVDSACNTQTRVRRRI